MALEQGAWLVDGPLIHSEAARRALYASVGGAEGVVNRGDMKVSPTLTPSGAVRVADGAALLTNKSGAGAPNVYPLKETYSIYNDASASVSVDPTSGAARSDLVVARVRDPQYAPWPLPDVGAENDYEYIQFFVIKGVPAGTKRFRDLALNQYGGTSYTALELARIDIPSGTSTITSGMIVDLRSVARPRRETVQAHIVTATNDSLNPAVGVYELFPNGAFIDVFVPDWAVVAKIMGFAEGVTKVSDGSGKVRYAFVDGGATQATNIDENGSSNARKNYNAGGEIAIPDNYRGTTRRLRMEGTINGSGSSGFLLAEANKTSAAFLVTFEEKAE